MLASADLVDLCEAMPGYDSRSDSDPDRESGSQTSTVSRHFPPQTHTTDDNGVPYVTEILSVPRDERKRIIQLEAIRKKKPGKLKFIA